jgi:hypothetical protein
MITTQNIHFPGVDDLKVFTISSTERIADVLNSRSLSVVGSSNSSIRMFPTDRLLYELNPRPQRRLHPTQT